MGFMFLEYEGITRANANMEPMKTKSTSNKCREMDHFLHFHLISLYFRIFNFQEIHPKLSALALHTALNRCKQMSIYSRINMLLPG